MPRSGPGRRMPRVERCGACGRPIEPDRGLTIEDRVAVHDERCLREWSLREGFPTSGTVLMYRAGETGPLTPPGG
jgi:hypothetical protein